MVSALQRGKTSRRCARIRLHKENRSTNIFRVISMSMFWHSGRWWSSVCRSPQQSRPGNRHNTHRFILSVESMEGRFVPATTITGVFGTGVGGGPIVTVCFDDGTQFSFYAFDTSFRGGVSVALGEINGTGIPDVIVGAGPGGGPEVKVFNGAELLAGQVVATDNFYAFESNFDGGVTLAVGQVDGTSHDDVVVGAGGAVKVFDGAELAQGNPVATATFLASRPSGTNTTIHLDSDDNRSFTLAVGPVNGTGHSDVVVGSGAGVESDVKVIDGAMLAQGTAVVTAEFMPYDPDFLGGVTVATADITGSGHDDVVVAPGPGGGPDVKVYDGSQLAQGNAVATANFFAFDPAFVGGVSLAAGNINGTGHDDLIVGAGPGGGPQVKVFDGAQLAMGQVVTTASFYAFTTAFAGGVQVEVTSATGSARDIVNVVTDPGGGPEVETFDGTQLSMGDIAPQHTFYAFNPAFRGGVDLGFVFAASFLDPAFINSQPSFLQNHGSGRFHRTGIGTSSSGFGRFGRFGSGISSGGFTSGGSGGGGGSGGSGGSGGGGGSSLRVAGGSVGLGGKAQGGGLYLSPGQLTLPDLLSTPTTTGGGHRSSASISTFVTPGDLLGVIEEAITWWDEAGIDAAQDQRLRDVPFDIANLGGTTLGRTTSHSIIHLSTTAAGYGWFVDPTGTEGPVAGQMDLATVITHEMGLVLGLKETPTPGDIMDPFLAPGTREMPTSQDLDSLGT